MPGNREYEKLTVDQAVRRALKKSFDELTTVGFIMVLLHAVMFSPLLISRAFYGRLPVWMALIGVAAAYIFLVMPLRFWGREKVRRIFYSRHQPTRNNSPYTRWMHAGLLRLGRGLLWGLPFLAGLAYLLIGKSTLPFNEMWEPFRALAGLVGKEPDTATGMLVGLGLLLLFGLLFAYGWWRDMPFEYLPVRSLGRKHTLHYSRRIMKHYRRKIIRLTLVNILLCLPALAGYAAVLVPYVTRSVDFSLSRDLVLNLILRLLRTSLPSAQLAGLAAVTLLLYLPLCGIRKTRNAAAIAKFMRSTSPDRHHHHHSQTAPMPEEAPETTYRPDADEADDPNAAG